MRILVIEDEQKLARAIKRALELQNYAVDLAFDGESGLDLAVGENAYGVIISDVMLPKLSGFEVCQHLRQEKIQTPVLLLTAKGQVEDKVAGLDAGADDYLVKPFSFEELFARLRALVRRPPEQQESVLKIADLELDPIGLRVTRAGQEVQLSAREFALLEYLLRNKNQVLSKEKIVAHVWDYEADVLPSTVEVHIKHLRDKIDKSFKTKLIQTVRGFGYQLLAPEQKEKNV